MALSEILTFAFVASLLVMSPGPNGVLIAKTVPTSGRSAGFANVAGFVTGFYLHGAMAILGISIILVQSATAFAIVKYLGAAYLCWIGVEALVVAWQGVEGAHKVKPAATKRTLANAYVEGLLTNALNDVLSRGVSTIYHARRDYPYGLVYARVHPFDDQRCVVWSNGIGHLSPDLHRSER